jgi:hypothetical protein
MQAYGFSKSRRARILRIANRMVRDLLLSVLTLALVVHHVVEWSGKPFTLYVWHGLELNCWDYNAGSSEQQVCQRVLHTVSQKAQLDSVSISLSFLTHGNTSVRAEGKNLLVTFSLYALYSGNFFINSSSS